MWHSNAISRKVNGSYGTQVVSGFRHQAFHSKFKMISRVGRGSKILDLVLTEPQVGLVAEMRKASLYSPMLSPPRRLIPHTCEPGL